MMIDVYLCFFQPIRVTNRQSPGRGGSHPKLRSAGPIESRNVGPNSSSHFLSMAHERVI